MKRQVSLNYLGATIAGLLTLGCASTAKVSPPQIAHRTVDLRISEAQQVRLSDGKAVEVKPLDLQERKNDSN